MSILMAEYDFDTAIAVKQEEAYEQGVYQNKLETAKRLIDRGYITEEIVDLLDLSLLEIQRLMNN